MYIAPQASHAIVWPEYRWVAYRLHRHMLARRRPPRRCIRTARPCCSFLGGREVDPSLDFVVGISSSSLSSP